jgi:Zn-dependent protease with chaperone function
MNLERMISMRFLSIIIFLVLTLNQYSAAQDLVAQHDSITAASEESAPVAVPVPSEKAMDYYNSGNILWVVDTLWGILIPALFLFTGFSARIRDWAQKIGKKWFLVIGIYFLLFSIVTFVVGLPLSYYEEFIRQHAYDLSNQTFGKWLGDSLKALMVSSVIGFLFLWLPYLALKKSPKRWWIYVGIGTVPFLFLTLLISPIWMFEVNKSVDTKKVNAYVTGFMGTKRIVIWDNTIATMSEKELLFVLGHEMGHYVLGHIWKLIFFYSLLILVTLYVANRTAAALINKFKQRFGFDQLSDIASLPLIILLVNLFGLVLIDPIGNAFSRSIEHESDIFGLEITQDNHNAATAFVKLQMENLSNPRPGLLYKLWRANHPVLGDRIDFCNEYKPWEKGEKLEYGEYFRK